MCQSLLMSRAERGEVEVNQLVVHLFIAACLQAWKELPLAAPHRARGKERDEHSASNCRIDRPELTGLDSPRDYSGDKLLPAQNHFCAVEFNEVREVVQLADDDSIDDREGRRAHESPVVLHEGQQLLASGTQSWNSLASDDRLDNCRSHHFAKKRFLVREVEIDRSLGNAGASSDVFKPRTRQAVLAKYFERGSQNLLWAFFRKPPPTRLRNFSRHGSLEYITDRSVIYSAPFQSQRFAVVRFGLGDFATPPSLRIVRHSSRLPGWTESRLPFLSNSIFSSSLTWRSPGRSRNSLSRFPARISTIYQVGSLSLVFGS